MNTSIMIALGGNALSPKDKTGTIKEQFEMQKNERDLQKAHKEHADLHQEQLDLTNEDVALQQELVDLGAQEVTNAEEKLVILKKHFNNKQI